MLIARYAEKAGNVTNPAKYSISSAPPREKSTNAPKSAEYFRFSCAVAIGIGAATGNQPLVLIGTAKKAVSRLIGGIQRQIELNLKQARNEIIIYKYIVFSPLNFFPKAIYFYIGLSYNTVK